MVDVMNARKGESLYVQARHVVTTVEHFMASADEFITTAHVPNTHNKDGNGPSVAIPHDMQMVQFFVSWVLKLASFLGQATPQHGCHFLGSGDTPSLCTEQSLAISFTYSCVKRGSVVKNEKFICRVRCSKFDLFLFMPENDLA